MTDTLSRSAPTVEPVTRAELDDIVRRQRAAFLRDGDPPAAVRRDRIDRLLLAVLTHADALAAAADADFGQRAPAMTKSLEILSLLPDADDLREHLEEWMQPQRVDGLIPTVIQQKPLGVVGIMTAWNGPIMLAVMPALAALAAGNRVIIKSNDRQPRGGQTLAAAVAEHFDPTELTVVVGDFDTVQEFSKLQLDHLFFTGSPAVARIVAANAASNLVPVTLELGGKNPAVIDHSADLAAAAHVLAGARMLNGGQVCLCPDYVFVPEPQRDEFVTHLREALLELYPTTLYNPAVISIVDDANFDRVVSYIDDAVAKGATKIEAVPDDERAALPARRQRVIAPTILLDVTDDAAVAHHEIFGPVVPVYPYADPHEVIDYINARPAPLGASWFGADNAAFEEFLTRTTSGGVSRNDAMLHTFVSGAPFGGVGNSGTGAYHGKWGFDTFTHRRTVAAQHASGSVLDAITGGVVTSREYAETVDQQIEDAIAGIAARCRS